MQPVVFINDPEEIKLVADETRMRMLELLGGKERTSKELAEALDISQQLAYHHVKKLVDAGLVEISRTEQTGNITVYYYRAVAESFILSLSVRSDELVDQRVLEEEPPAPDEMTEEWIQSVQQVLTLLGLSVDDPDALREILETDAQAFRATYEALSRDLDPPDGNPRVVAPALKLATLAEMSDEDWEAWLDALQGVRDVLRRRGDGA